jgi:hypothetical protein
MKDAFDHGYFHFSLPDHLKLQVSIYDSQLNGAAQQ